MQLEKRTIGDVAIVKVTGRLTLEEIPEAMLHETVRALVERGHRKVLVDLAAVPYVDSAGLGELVRTNSLVKNRGGALKVSGPTHRIREMFVLTRLTKVLGIYDHESEALDSFGARQA